MTDQVRKDVRNEVREEVDNRYASDSKTFFKTHLTKREKVYMSACKDIQNILDPTKLCPIPLSSYPPPPPPPSPLPPSLPFLLLNFIGHTVFSMEQVLNTFEKKQNRNNI